MPAPGAGRKPLAQRDPTLLRDLEALIEPVTRGDPMSPLRWTCLSTRQLAAALGQQGHRVSHQTVAELLHARNYSVQGNRKTKEGAHHPDRNAQFEYINRQTQAFQEHGQPVISVDTKKKDLIGSTTTRTGLAIRAALDPGTYPTGIKVTDAELAAVRLQPATFHGDWNYAISPQSGSLAQVIP